MAQVNFRIDDMEHGRNCHVHTDEEMEHMIAEVEERQKAPKQTGSSRRTANRTARGRRSA